jgi:prepilin-type N-terminal cleavage/methylation domain-containing protein
MRRRHFTRGFTLIELLVVIAIIGILSAVVLASLNAARVKGRDARRYSDMQSVVQALELYANDHGGAYPVSAADSACGGSFGCITNLQTPLVPKYLPSIPQDPTQSGTVSNYRYCSSNAGSPTTYVLLICPEGKSSCCLPAQSGGDNPDTTICASSWGSAGANYQSCSQTS